MAILSVLLYEKTVCKFYQILSTYQKIVDQVWWYMHVISATGRCRQVDRGLSQPQVKSVRLSLSKKELKQKGLGHVSSAECLPCQLKALSSNPSINSPLP
jgi:hypothetical protein